MLGGGGGGCGGGASRSFIRREDLLKGAKVFITLVSETRAILNFLNM